VTCVGVYENGTYMYGGVLVCLSVVVVPTPRLVCILCALSCGFFTSFIYHMSCIFDYPLTYQSLLEVVQFFQFLATNNHKFSLLLYKYYVA